MRLYMPTKVFFGSGCVSENGAELKALGSRAMIVTGKHSSRINGSLAAVEQALQANGQTYVIFDEIEENPSVETVAVAAGIAVKEQVDFFVAVGGGSPMDASKAISLLAANPSAIDHAEERLYHPEPMQGYPVAAVPTTSGTGSEVTPYAILTRHDLHTKQSIAHKWFADLAFVDAGYVKTSSYENMVSTCVDALAHLIESYLNTNANAYNGYIQRKVFGSGAVQRNTCFLPRLRFRMKDTKHSCMHRLWQVWRLHIPVPVFRTD